jgi:hypothetical protein
MAALGTIIVLESRLDEDTLAGHNVLDVLEQLIEEVGLSLAEKLL